MAAQCRPLQPVQGDPTDSSKLWCQTDPSACGVFVIPKTLADLCGVFVLPLSSVFVSLTEELLRCLSLSRSPGKQQQPPWAPCSSQSSISVQQEILAGCMRVEGWTSTDRSLAGFWNLPWNLLGNNSKEMMMHDCPKTCKPVAIMWTGGCWASPSSAP